ncbi:hypothetical protein BH11BAC3_BH11BAC3_02780 [soil metagenome]
MKKEILIREFIQKVWNEKNFDCIPTYMAPGYTIYWDPSDPWDGRTLNYEAYAMRLDYYFDAFPDINFEIKTVIAEGTSVAVIWIKTGINNGKHGAFPPTGKSIRATGSTIYHFNNGKICGHTQVVDGTAVMKQLRFYKINKKKQSLLFQLI